MINLLLIASSFVPSLGIVFRTIDKSMPDVITFSSICWLLYSVFVLIVYISFGDKTYVFSTISNSFITVFQMFLGEFPYTAMYNADPVISAFVLFSFVVLMNFLVINMYTAIVIRTYNKLQGRMLFLGESMARILTKHGKKKAKNLMNLICCRSNIKKPKDDKAS